MEHNNFFQHDKMNRKLLAQQWMNTLLSNKEHLVIAIDGAWGTGKTFFAKNWEEMLENNGFKVCYIDAFKYDFTDDAFMVISSEIIDTLSLKEAEGISDKVGYLMQTVKNKNIMSNILGGILSIATSGVINKDLIQTGMETYQKCRDNNPFSNSKLFHDYNKSIAEFKDFIKKNIKDNKKPLIVMIDELDRCKPVFAVECLEKVKHIFDIDNIIFILFVNEDELAKAIQGVYGENYDGKYYLSKFYSLKLNINNEDAIKQYIGRNQGFDLFISNKLQEILDADIYKNPYKEMAVIDLFNVLHNKYKFTLRDIEHILKPLKYVKLSNDFICGIFITLKIIQIKDNSLFNQIMKKSNINLESYFRDISMDKVYYLQRLIGVYKAWFEDEQTYNDYNSERAVISRHYGSVNSFFKYMEQTILFLSKMDG